MWQWVFDNAEALAALAAVVAFLSPVAWWALRKAVAMLLASRQRSRKELAEDRERVEKLIHSVEETGRQVALMRTEQEDTARQVTLMRSEQVSFKTRLETMAARHWAMLAGAKDPTFETDAQGNLWRVNRAYVEMVGRSAEEVTARGWENTIHPADRDRVVEEWFDAIAAKRGFESEFRVVSRPGKVVHHVRCITTPLFCDAQILTGYLGHYELVEQPN